MIFIRGGVVVQPRPVRSATAYRFTASEIGPAFRKLPGECWPPRQAAIHWRRPGDDFSPVRALPALRWLRQGVPSSGVRESARVLDAESGEDLALVADEHHAFGAELLAILLELLGRGRRMPPSYQMRSTAAAGPAPDTVKRTMLAVGNEKSFLIVVDDAVRQDADRG